MLETTPTLLTFPLQNGYIHHWLATESVSTPVENLAQFSKPNRKAQIAEYLYSADSGVSDYPVELAKFQPSRAEQELTWRMTTCDVDHFVNRSDFFYTCHHLRCWAYTILESPSEQTVTLTLTTNGPADAWINGEYVHRQTHFAHQIPASVSFEVTLAEGQNHLLVRFEGVAVREYPYLMAVKVASRQVASEQVDETGIQVQIPTTIGPLETREALEKTFANAWIERDVFAHDEYIHVRWPINEPCTRNICLRVQTLSGRIYSEQHTEGKTIHETRTGRAYQFTEGPHELVLMPHPEDYYSHGLRIKRALSVHTVRNRYSDAPYDTYSARRIEALKDASGRNTGLFSQIAKMALGFWPQVKTEPILETLDKINQRADCSDFDMVGVLGMVGRYWEDENFPVALRQPIRDCILNFKYWIDEPGDDAMCYWSENHQILFHTCEILAGQLMADETFSNSGLKGHQHQEKGEAMAISWLRKRGAGGFREWDSNTYFEEDVLALTHLVDFAEDDDVAELAAVVLDKMFFSLAMNSFRGVFGSTHGRTYAPYIKGGYLEPTAGTSRLLWGMGIFNARILGTVSLACCENYQLPSLIEEIAVGLPEGLWSRERHAGELEEWCDQETGEWEVNKVMYKTVDYMICSAQDYRPGEAGYQQHIWQATFNQDAVVFVTHPSCMSEDGSHRPNFWHGNVSLPRVAQWKDALVAVHNMPDDDWMGFTHAYFPTYAFDSWKTKSGWAFAQAGEGYIALTASQGIELITTGNNAYRELRSHGTKNVWLCMMGRKALDGTFNEFQQKILALDITLNEQSVHGDTLRNETIDFGWTGPLLVNEVEQPISGFKHYDSPFCQAELGDEQMEIQLGDQMMRLRF
ncbi:MAG: hypothetical protein AAF702_34980 [Chloroflexota bacterium]